MTAAELFNDLRFLGPELILAATGVLALIMGVHVREDQPRPVETLCAAALVLAAGVAMFAPTPSGGEIFSGSLKVDAFARFMKPVTFLSAAAALLLSCGFLRREGLARFEYPVLVVFAALGMSVMISAADLLTLYVGLEMQSLSLYVLACVNRDSPRATEAGVKYFALGALASGILLYGMTLTYGAAGGSRFADIYGVAAEGGSTLFTVGVVFMLAGLAFKISAAPFHMWTPDVYEGAPTPVTAFFAAAPKVAAMALIARLVFEAFGPAEDAWRQVLAAASALSMAWGAIAALNQTNIKRLLAYSSIGHMGYALAGLAAGGPQGAESVALYMAIYVITTLGAFACVLTMRAGDGQLEDLTDLAGLSKSRPGLAFAFILLLFSLAGAPPLAGFFAKWFVFSAVVEAGMIWLAVVGLVSSVVGAAYYLRVVKILYFDDPAPEFQRLGDRAVAGTIALSSLAVFPVLVVAVAPLRDWASAAAAALF